MSTPLLTDRNSYPDEGILLIAAGEIFPVLQKFFQQLQVRIIYWSLNGNIITMVNRGSVKYHLKRKPFYGFLYGKAILKPDFIFRKKQWQVFLI